MGLEVPHKVEVRRESRLRKHAPAIAAHRKGLALLNDVTGVEREGLFLFRHAAAIHDRLAIVHSLLPRLIYRFH